MTTRASSLYTSRRVAPLLGLGFASGLPLALTGGTLQAWATVEQISLQQIGFLTLVGTVDYRTGFDYSFSVFYLLGIGLATWYLGRGFTILRGQIC